jgi:4-hydroxy-4-methyl-2-oxoglutarate aldolase
VLFVAADRVEEVLATAHEIWRTEREQARRILAGQTLREQTTTPAARRRRVEHLRHLRETGGAIEE